MWGRKRTDAYVNQAMESLLESWEERIINRSRETLRTQLADFYNQQDKVPELKRQINNLEDQKAKLDRQIDTQQKKKKMFEEEIAHQIRILEEKQGIEIQKKELELQKQYLEDKLELTGAHHKEQMEALEKNAEKTEQVLEAVMSLLPNVNVRLQDRNVTQTRTNVKEGPK